MRSILTLLALAALAWACQVPVFRYALERWESDPYQLYITSPAPLTDSQKSEIETFKKQLTHTNLELKIINTSTLKDSDLWTLPEINTSPTAPTINLFPPKTIQVKAPLITLPLNAKNLDSIIHSPTRDVIIKDIIAGNSATWLVIHKNAPEAAAKVQIQLKKHLESAQQKITIPEGIIGTEQRADITNHTNMDDVLRSSIPLKIAFATLTLDATDPSEQAFVATLIANAAPALKSLDQPLIIPIFGRGRKIAPLPSTELTEAAILERATYLCGACSCQVKEQNPGADLLIHQDWAAHLTTGLAVIEKTLPPLTGSIQPDAEPSSQEPEPNSSALNTYIIDGGIITKIALPALAIIALITVIILRQTKQQ